MEASFADMQVGSISQNLCVSTWCSKLLLASLPALVPSDDMCRLLHITHPSAEQLDPHLSDAPAAKAQHVCRLRSGAVQSWLGRLTSKRSAWRWRGSKPRPNALNSSIDHFIIGSILHRGCGCDYEKKYVFPSYAVVPMGTLCTMDSFCICWQLQTELGL